jgi:diguanylate cyclase
VQNCARWQAAGVALGVSFHLTTADVLNSRLPYELARLVSEAGVPPTAIQLELAEDLLLVDPGRTRRALTQYRTLGFRLALDHYGRSAPSLTRLRTMPVQELNLDRSFVATVLHSGPDEAVVRSTVMLANSLSIRTLADGVAPPTCSTGSAPIACARSKEPWPVAPCRPPSSPSGSAPPNRHPYHNPSASGHTVHHAPAGP